MKIFESDKINSILIIRLSSMGDVVLTTHLIRNLKLSFPDVPIDYITLNSYSEILENSPFLRNLFLYKKTFNPIEEKKFITDILNSNQGKYSVVFDLQKNFRSKKLIKLLTDKVLTIRKRRLHKLSLVYLKKALDINNKSIPDIYFEPAKLLKTTDDNLGLQIWTDEDKKQNKYLPFQRENIRKEKYIFGIAPGAHFFTKRFPQDKFVKLIDLINKKYNCEFVLLGGEEDYNLCIEIQNKSIAKIHNHSGSKSILSTIQSIDLCDLIITNDTGIMHLASARQIPIVAIFGSTVKEFGFSPFRVLNIFSEVDLDCRPCSHIGRNSCPKKHFNCMNLIQESEIVDNIQKLLEKFN